MGPRTECAYFKGRNLGASGWSRSGGATRRAGKLGSKKGVNYGWGRKERSIDAGASVADQIRCADPCGGRGTRLKDLTNKRAKPAVHFGGKFRIIDFALSNCINSGIRRIGVITQYQSHTLVQHIQRGWSFFNEEMNEFVDLLPAQQRMQGKTGIAARRMR
jgi:hypothetical protein